MKVNYNKQDMNVQLSMSQLWIRYGYIDVWSVFHGVARGGDAARDDPLPAHGEAGELVEEMNGWLCHQLMAHVPAPKILSHAEQAGNAEKYISDE